MYTRNIIRSVLLATIFGTQAANATTIEGWGVVGNNLYQISFDSSAATTAATRTLFTTLPDSSVVSMAIAPDGQSLYAISAAGNTVYNVDLNTGVSTSIGQVPTAFDLPGADTRGDEIILIDNGVLPTVWTLDTDDASASTQTYTTSETTSIGGRAQTMVNVDDDTVLFFNDEHNASSSRRRAWTLDNDGTTTLLGTIIDEFGNDVQLINGSDIAADGLLYGLAANRNIWQIDYANAHDGIVEATLVDAFTPDGLSSYGWEAVVFAPAAVVPLPAAVWLFGSGLLGIAGLARLNKKQGKNAAR